MQIRFGSDGFRGIIGAEFTRHSVARIALGVADFLREAHPETISRPLPIGYDTRFESRMFARYCAAMLAGEGISSVIATRPCPSPYLSFVTREFDVPVGIQITASHNPPMYNGIKLKGAHGGSLLPDQVRRIEELATAVDAERIDSRSLDPRGDNAASFDLEQQYADAVRAASHSSGTSRMRLALDFMHGTGAGIYNDILSQSYTIAARLRSSPDPLFGGVKPEPVSANLAGLAKQVMYVGDGTIGLAFDGDGDRLGVIDEEGRWLETHEIFCLLLKAAVRISGPGMVVRTVSFSSLVDKLAAELGCETIEVPVGYKNVSDAMLQSGAIIGGEESGGTGFGHYLPERDALLMALIFLGSIEESGQSVAQNVAELYRQFGEHHFVHRDVKLPQGSDPQQLRERVSALAGSSEIAGLPVRDVGLADGVKLITDAGWVLLRPSGTEPLLRVYSEAESVDLAELLANAALARVQG